MKIIITHCAKRGLPDYSSVSYGCSLEVELRDGTPEEVASTFKAAASDLRRLVEAELAREQAPTSGTGSTAYGRGSNEHQAGGSGAARGARPGGPATVTISPKQMKFLTGLRRRAHLSPRDLDQRAQEIKGDPAATVGDLTKREASDLIEELLSQTEAA